MTRIVVARISTFSIMMIVGSRIRIMNTSIMMGNDVTTLTSTHPVAIIPVITTYVTTFVVTHRNLITVTVVIISIYNNMRSNNHCNNDSGNHCDGTITNPPETIYINNKNDCCSNCGNCDDATSNCTSCSNSYWDFINY